MSETPTPPTLEQRAEQLERAARYVVDRFKADEAQGYRSRDRQFAIEILEPVLSALQDVRAEALQEQKTDEA